MDGAGIAAVLALGAQAAQLGTAFISCAESAASDEFKRALKGESALHTIITRVISGRPARGIANRLTTALENDTELPQIPSYPMPYYAVKTLHTVANAQDSQDFAAWLAGQSAGLSRSMPAGELIELLKQEIATALGNLSDSA